MKIWQENMGILKNQSLVKENAVKKTAYDQVIEYFNPQRAMQRYKARAMIGAYEKSGGYIGASRSRPALGAYNPISGDVNEDTIQDLPTLRTRARDLVRNAPIAGGAIKTMVTYVIGTGLSMRASIDGTKLGLESGQAGIWQDDVNSRFSLWAESTDCDIARGLNFYGIQALAFRSMLESGDVFCILTEAQRNGRTVPAVQLIEADRVCNKDDARDTATLIGGVELDGFGCPVNYHICNQHPTSWKPGLKRSWTIVPAFGAKTDRRNVIHLFERLRPGQTRGVPVLAPVIEPLKQLARYTEAELQAAVVSGAFAVFLKMDPQAFGDLFDDQGRKSYMESASKWKGDYPDSGLDGPGKAVNLLPGESLEMSNPGRPNSEFDPFVQAILRQIGVELGLPFEVLIKHFTSSYSAARAALLDAWRIFRIKREFMASYFCGPIYEDWLSREVAVNNIQARGYFEDPILRANWENSNWIGDGPGSIDPQREADAARQRVDLGISTIANESVLHDGLDWWSKHKARTNEHKMRVSAGLEPAIVTQVGQ
jgi:lambda family phage portal protein